MSIALPDVRVIELDEDIWQRADSEIAGVLWQESVT